MSPVARKKLAAFRGTRIGGVAVYFAREGQHGYAEHEAVKTVSPGIEAAPAEFEWGSPSRGAAQLGLAILFRYFLHVGLPREAASREACSFMEAFVMRRVASWSGDTWEISIPQITNDLAAIDTGRRKEAFDV